MYRKYFKRFIDWFVAIMAFIILFPIFILVTILLIIANNGSPFFIQKRPGKDEKIFSIVKFKTMNDKKDSDGNLMPDRLRLTPIGAFVRKLSLDEIPQLINIIKGDMSLIGPRPLLVKYLPYYTEKERTRHNVRPGITGWAQINGRNTLKWNDRLSFDVEYVKSISFLFDIKILYKTFLKVVKSENIVIDPESVMKNLDDERKSA